MPDIQLTLLGSIGLSVDGVVCYLGTARQREVFASLAIRRQTPVTVEQLVTDVWGADPPATAANLVHTYLGRVRTAMRRALGSRTKSVLRSRCPGYLLALPYDAVDANRFEQGMNDARAARAAGDEELARRTLERALGLWRGPQALLEATGPLALAERYRLDELRLECVEELSSLRLSTGDVHGLVADLRSLVSLHPLRESLWELLLNALVHSARRAEALDAFAQARETLSERLGVEPGPPMQSLHRDLLRTDMR